MSHIVESRSTITCPNLPEFLALSRQGGAASVSHLPFLALLREAVKLVATTYGGTIETFYYDYSRRKHHVNTGLALHIPQQPGTPAAQALTRGIGLAIDEQTGVLKCIGDPYGVEDFYRQIQQQIIQKYIGLAWMAVMRQFQYQTSSQVVENRLVIAGVC